MIFVSIGTHYQPFDRLIKMVDDLARWQIINEYTFIQIGYTKYMPRYCAFAPMIRFQEMQHYTKNARIIICHGAPASIVQALRCHKTPIVVPRTKKFHEHVTDHQVIFTKQMAKMGLIIPVYEIKELRNAIVNYNRLQSHLIKTNSKDTIPLKYVQKFNEIFKSV